MLILTRVLIVTYIGIHMLYAGTELYDSFDLLPEAEFMMDRFLLTAYIVANAALMYMLVRSVRLCNCGDDKP